ncbi:MAG: methionine--tRNA ligase [Planctomycetota bacterium]
MSAASTTRSAAAGPRPLLITAALPYANGPLHLGHIAGAYLPADLYARYQRLARGLGAESSAARFAGGEPRRDPGVLFICGTDEHGVAITVNAEREKKDFQAYVDHWHGEIARLFERFRISFDQFSRTTNREPHYRLSQEFFLRLLRTGNLRRQEVQQQYSPKTGRFLADRYVLGTCYLCGHSPARGDECPKCGAWLDATKLKDAVSTLDPTDRLELRPAWQFELDMAPISGGPEALRRAYGSFFVDYLGWMRARLKPNVRTMMFDKLIDGEGMRARPITRDLPWGVPLPQYALPARPGESQGESLGDVSGKVLYVWFDAPIGYVSATIEWARDVLAEPAAWRQYWIASAPAAATAASAESRDRSYLRAGELVHFIGKDNIPFHGIVFPAMLAGQSAEAGDAQSAASVGGAADAAGATECLPPGSLAPGAPLLGPGPGERYVLPDNVPANEFYNLEGRKFSTSDKWTVDPHHLAEVFGVDALRWYLTVSMPETADSQFTFAGLQAETNLLADVIGNYASRVLKFIQTHLGGGVPRFSETAGWDPGFKLDDPDRKPPRQHYADVVAQYVANTGQALADCDFRDAAEIALNLGRFGNGQFDLHAPWKLRKSNLEQCGCSLFIHVQILAGLSVVLTPFVPDAAARLRAMLNLPPVRAWTPSGLPPGESLPGATHEHEIPAGHALGEPGILFTKIPDEIVERERAALLGTSPSPSQQP